MEENEIDLNALPEASDIEDDDEFIVVDKFDIITELGNQHRKINYVTLKDQIIPENPRKGARGIDGDKGIEGDSGPTGDKGARGDKGEPGLQGLRGYFGFGGIKGVKGEKGDLGNKGYKGTTGSTGLVGDDGFEGDVGESGDPGLTGSRGFRGDHGQDGDKGQLGPKGLRGDFNSKIFTGKKGEKGPAGFSRKGSKGQRGEKGNRGDRGDRGHRGRPGRDFLNIEVKASDMTGDRWIKKDLEGELIFNDTRMVGYSENSRFLIKVNKGSYFGKWKTQNDLYAEVCLQNADPVKGPTIFSGFLLGLVDDRMYPVMLMPYSSGQNFILKVCAFDGYTRFDLPYEIYECDEY